MRSRMLKLLTLPALLAGLTALGISAVDGSERARGTVNWLSSELDWLAEVQRSTKRIPREEGAKVQPAAVEVVEARVRPVAELRPAAVAEVVEARVRPIEEVRVATEPAVAPEVTAGIVSIKEVRARLAAVKADAPGAQDGGSSVATDANQSDAVSDRLAGMGALMASASVAPDQLGELRGGFETPGGLRLNFGIERVVMINGVLQSTTSLRIDELGKLVGGKAVDDALAAGNTLAVIQSGQNNVVTSPLPGTTLATVVQNSLNNQKIQSVTTINATINSAEVMRQMRMQQSLQEALGRSALMR